VKRFAISLLIAGLPLAAQIRIGIVGTDTSHVPAFTAMLNDAQNKDHLPGARVVAAYKGGSADLPSSADRVEKYASEIQSKYGVELVPDIATLCSKVDAVLLESVDGRPHLAQAREVIKARKPLFIDKPLASTYEDAKEIARLAKEAGVPWFSASSLRFSPRLVPLKQPGLTGAFAWGPAELEPHHKLDLSWYGIHTVEILYALMGTGCVEVTRVASESTDVITGRWKDGRLGTVHAIRPYSEFGAVALMGRKLVQSKETLNAGYKDLVVEILRFFQTGKPPVPPAETLEMFAFMDAAQRSKEAAGKAMPLR
jgi:hypothetical protein